ncbi:MAG: P1 family peptidase [Gammaproteobacteria bacterium]
MITYGYAIGVLPTGKWNAITDVSGVLVGEKTRIEGNDVRTGVTVFLPYAGNIFQDRVPAAVYFANGFGKLTGTTDIVELGSIETSIVLTNPKEEFPRLCPEHVPQILLDTGPRGV